MKKIMPLLMLMLTGAFSWCDQGFGDIFDGSPTAQTDGDRSVRLSGEFGLDLTYYGDDESESPAEGLPYARLDLVASSPSVAGRLRLLLNADPSELDVPMEKILDELYLSAFFPRAYLEAGLMKVEWGKGDGVHVIDPLNPLDQTRGYSLDLNEMKRAEIMAKLNFHIGAQGLLEIVYKPFFHPLVTATTGRWALPLLLPNPNAPDTEDFSYGQGAVRFTTSVGALDIGALYYYGYLMTPGYEFETVFIGEEPYTPDYYTVQTNILYTQAHLFGLEGAWAAGPFTFRTEAGYWLSEDREGEEPEHYNSSLVFLAAMDVLVPGTDFFVSLQATESLVMAYEDLLDEDVNSQASYGNAAHTTYLMGSAEYPFLKERMKLRLSVIALLEARGYLVIPEFFWMPVDDLELSLTGRIFDGKDIGHSPFYAWRDNDLVKISLKVLF